MTDRRIVSARFLDKPSGAPARFLRPGDVVNAAEPGAGDQTDRLAPIHRQLADAVAQAVRSGERPCAILGDCCQVIPVMAGLDRCGQKSSLIWLDSHGDFNTWDTTPSGFLGGMPLAMLTGRGDQRMMQAVGLSPVEDARVVLSDGRDLDPGERNLVEQSGIAHVALDGVVEAMPSGPAHLHVDVDILDSRIAPAFKYPVIGGPTPDELAAQLTRILATGRVTSISICAAWDDTHPESEKSYAAIQHAIAPVLAE